MKIVRLGGTALLRKPLLLSTLGALALLAGLSLADNSDSKADMTIGQLAENYAVATFAGGCFWCTEADFEKAEGVVEAISGYTGGDSENPTYDQVSSGTTGHVEAVQVYYDPALISYDDLLQVFWRDIDPTDKGGQFVDRGYQYSPHIFYHNASQRQVAQQGLEQLTQSSRYQEPIVVGLHAAEKFWVAEDYHQDYYQKNPIRYKFYRFNSGRDQYLQDTWGDALQYTPKGPADKAAQSQPAASGLETAAAASAPYSKPSDEELRRRLTEMQYRVTQEDGTEPAYKNAYWDEKRPGIYVDIVSGEPLFSSLHKYDSKTGWPSFTRPLEKANIVRRNDYGLFGTRIEVRSKHGDSHLGHVFDDGPEPTGLRYCMNSAALRFIPADELQQQGYGQYASLFEE